MKLGWNKDTIPKVTVEIKKIKLYTIPKFGYGGGCSPFFGIENVKENEEPFLWDSKKQFSIKSYKSEAYIEYSGIQDAVVSGDVLVEFFHSGLLKKVDLKESLFY